MILHQRGFNCVICINISYIHLVQHEQVRPNQVHRLLKSRVSARYRYVNALLRKDNKVLYWTSKCRSLTSTEIYSQIFLTKWLQQIIYDFLLLFQDDRLCSVRGGKSGEWQNICLIKFTMMMMMMMMMMMHWWYVCSSNCFQCIQHIRTATSSLHLQLASPSPLLALHQLFTALIVNKITYALPAFAGQLTADDRNRVNSTSRKALRRGLTHAAFDIDAVSYTHLTLPTIYSV